MKIVLKYQKYTNECVLLGLLLNSTLISILIKEVVSIFSSRVTLNNSILELGIIAIPLLKYVYKLMMVGINKVHIWLMVVPLLLFLHAALIADIPNALLMDGMIKFYSRVVLIAFLFYEIEDMRDFEDSLKPYVILSILLTSIRIFVTPSESNFYFTYTYAIIIPVLLCVVLAYNGQKKYILYALVLSVGIFVFGARGGLLCIGVVWLLLSVLYFTDRKGIVRNLFLFFIAIVVIIARDVLVQLLVKYFENSRIVNFAVGNITDNSRSIMWKSEIEVFLSDPFTIRGLFSDRLYLGDINSGITRLIGSYSHNFIFELLYEFGIIGIIAAVYFIFLMVRMFLRAKKTMNTSEINIMILMMAYFIGKLSISSSYLIDRASGCVLGILLVFNGIRRYGTDYKMVCKKLWC